MFKVLKCALLHRQKIYMTTPAGRKVVFLCADCNPGVHMLFGRFGPPPLMTRPELPPELRN